MVKKALLGFVFGMVLLLVVGVFATASENLSEDIEEEIEKVVKKVSNPKALAEKTKEYVKEFVKKKGIKAEQVKNITEVDFESLPKEVNIEGVDDSNLAIYQVDYEEDDQSDEEIFVITYSTSELKAQGDIIIAQDKRQFLHFGAIEKMHK